MDASLLAAPLGGIQQNDPLPATFWEQAASSPSSDATEAEKANRAKTGKSAKPCSYSARGKRIGRPRVDRGNTRCHECNTATTPQWRYLSCDEILSSPVSLRAFGRSGRRISQTAERTVRICLCNACWLRAHKLLRKLKGNSEEGHRDEKPTRMFQEILTFNRREEPADTASVEWPVPSLEDFSKVAPTVSVDDSSQSYFSQSMHLPSVLFQMPSVTKNSPSFSHYELYRDIQESIEDQRAPSVPWEDANLIPSLKEEEIVALLQSPFSATSDAFFKSLADQSFNGASEATDFESLSSSGSLC